MKVILLDIEGTTTPVDFVYGTLFSYARKHLESFIGRNDLRADFSSLEAEYHGDASTSKPAWSVPPLAYLFWLMDQDRKSPALKSMQGKIWKAGYEDGTLKSKLFPDVLPAIKRWKSEGKAVCIYSSGSVLAQQLLFRYADVGDLTAFLDGYFDTEAGPKKEASSYRAIAGRIGVTPEEILFISDSAAECEAAREAGCLVRYSVRPGNKEEEAAFARITSFEEIKTT